jgi:hypothetical protein
LKGRLGASHSLLVSGVRTGLLLLLGRRGSTFLLLVHDEASVALFGVPLETGEDGKVDLVVLLLRFVSEAVVET